MLAEADSISGTSAVTVTTDVVGPTSSFTSTVRTSPTDTAIGPRSCFLKPCNSTAMRYSPGSTLSSSKIPALLEDVFTLALVAACVIVISAPATSASLGSVMRPVTRP